MKKIQSTQIENKTIIKMVKYGASLNVYQRCEESEDKCYVLAETKEFADISEVNNYIREQDFCNEYLEIVLNKNLTIEQGNQNVLNYSGVKPKVRIYLNGYQLFVKTDLVLCADSIDGSRWKNHKDEKVLASVSKVKIEKGKTVTVLAQENVKESDKTDITFLNFETQNNKIVIGQKNSLKHIIFHKVSFDKTLKSLEINGSFYYVDTIRKENKKLDVENLRVTNTECEASILVPVKVKDLYLDGRINVLNFKSLGKVSTNAASRFCVLPDGIADLNNIKVSYFENNISDDFCFAMEQKVSLIKYENYSQEEWKKVFEDGTENSQIWDDIFEKVKLLSARGKLCINGNIKFSGKETATIRMEKYFCWKAQRTEADIQDVYFKYMVEFNKKTVIVDGESIVTIPKTTANDFSIGYEGICLAKYGKHLKAVVTTMAVICENTGQRMEYETFEDAVENLKTDFLPKKSKDRKKLRFQFLFYKDQVLTKNISFPSFVEKITFLSPRVRKENGCLIKKLELNEYTLSLYGLLVLNSGLRIISSGKPGTLKLMGKRKEAGMDIAIGGKYFHTPQEIYEPELFYPLKNVNVLSANGCITLGGTRNGGVDGNLTVYECVISNNCWEIDSITSTNLFVSGKRPVLEEEKSVEEARLICDKIQAAGKILIETDSQKEKIFCNKLEAKILELHEGLIRVLKSANIGDVLLFGNMPNIRVDGNIFQIKGKVVCGAAQARLTTALNQKNEAALYLEGQVELLNNEKYGVCGKKLIVNVISKEEKLDLRAEEANKNVLLKVKNAKETDFLAEECNGKVFDIFENDNDSYVLKKNKNVIEVLGGEKVKVALFAEEQELKLINSYGDVNEAIMAIDLLKNKNANYVIRIRETLGGEGKKERIELKLPKYANKVTFTAAENVTIWCKKMLVQKNHIRLENVNLNSISEYNMAKGDLELIHSKLEVYKLNGKKIKMSESEIITKGLSVLKHLFLMEGEERVNRSMITAYQKLLIGNMSGIGDLITSGNVILRNSQDADLEDYTET